MMNRERSMAGLNLALGIGIGSIFGMAVGAFMAKSEKGAQNKSAGGFSKNSVADIIKTNVEFAREYGSGSQGVSVQDEEKIVYGHGLNYGVSGYGSGIHDSQTNINRKESGSLNYSPTGYGYMGGTQSSGNELE